MIPKDQALLVTQVRNEPGFLIFVQGETFVIVVGNRSQSQQGLLGDRQQTVLLRGNSDSSPGVEVHHAQGIFPRCMDRTVDGETSGIDVVRTVQDLLAFQIDLDQTRGGYFVEHQTVWVDQEVVVTTGYSR